MTPEERPDRCERCRFWEHKPTDDLGECHRFPPLMTIIPRYPLSKDPNDYGIMETTKPQDGGWSLTWSEDWCGEFREKTD
jgi:hypothetical protein